MKVLVIGSGGREHALVWKLQQSSLVDKVYCCPGNGGTAVEAENIDIDISDFGKLALFAEEKSIDMTVVGPEVPLSGGIVNVFNEHGLEIFGPTKEAAQLEGSKAFSKEFMKRHNIPTADFTVFDCVPDKRFAGDYQKPLAVSCRRGAGNQLCRDSVYGI